jgi:HSP20 family protein
MALEKWHPLKELETMRRDMDRIWEDLFPVAKRVESPWRKANADKGVAYPAIDIIDWDAEIVVRAEVPGVKKDDIDISLQEGTLTIKGEIKEENGGQETCSYSERNYSSYLRSINIPFKIKADGITARLKDGILSIHLPKAMEAETKKITIEAS